MIEMEYVSNAWNIKLLKKMYLGSISLMIKSSLEVLDVTLHLNKDYDDAYLNLAL